jgi:hypothetical protein
MNSDELQNTEQKPEKQPASEESVAFEQEPSTTAEVLDNSDNLEQPNRAYELNLLPLPDEDSVAESSELNLLPLPDEANVEEQQELEAETALFELVQPIDNQQEAVEDLTQTVADLERQERDLRKKIAVLQETQSKILAEQLAQTQAAVERMVQEGLLELEQRKQALQISVEQLERRRERIRAEMRTSFAGVSQELAIRVQGFKDYLVGSLQDLASAAEQLELASPQEAPRQVVEESRETQKTSSTPKFAEQGFEEQARQIRKILDQYRTLPDYYGPPWQLRRTFEPVHAERVSNWFFTQGGRGAIKTMGSRLQNILVASATISVMRSLYGDRLRTLIIANSPERLGEWRRGLQDCLGISRSDFGPERGLVLFEEAPALVQKADRLLAQKQLPLIIVDETEDQISLSMLQFPLWLAFAPDPQQMSSNYDY